MKATIRDVAKLSGVSMSTVSRVMNMPESVIPSKRKKVEQAIKDLRYSPNALARSLINKRTQSFGVLIPDVSNSYVSEVIRGMEDAAHKLGNNLVICNTDRNKEKMIKYLKVLQEKQVDGIIFTSEFMSEDYYQIFSESNMPIVLASSETHDFEIPSVKIDDQKAGYDGTKYLIAKGHKEIGMISGPLEDPIAGATRMKGYKLAMEETFHKTVNESYIVYGNYRYEDGYVGMDKLLSTYANVTAVFVASDEMALGAISFLDDNGIYVPKNISVLGFDNTKISNMSIPKLTTVGQPMYEIGKLSVQKLERILQGEDVGELRTFLPHQIIERQSVRTRGDGSHESF